MFLEDHYARASGIAWIHGNSFVPLAVLMLFGLLLIPVELVRFILYLFARIKRPPLLDRLWAIYVGGLIIYFLLVIIKVAF